MQTPPSESDLCIAQFLCVILNEIELSKRSEWWAGPPAASFYHKCSSSAWLWTFYLLKSFQKISGKCVNIFQHWYTCCTVAHVFYVNMLPRGSSLKTDVKFNTCLTNKINVRFFVKCQLLFDAFCFWYYLKEKKMKKKETSLIIFAMDKKKRLLTQVLSKVPSTLNLNWWFIFLYIFLFCFSSTAAV